MGGEGIEGKNSQKNGFMNDPLNYPIFYYFGQ